MAGCRVTHPLLAQEGRELFSFSGFDEPALEVGLHRHARPITTLPHGDRYTRHTAHKMRDTATAPRLTRIKTRLVRVFHVKQRTRQGFSLPMSSLRADTFALPTGRPAHCQIKPHRTSRTSMSKLWPTVSPVSDAHVAHINQCLTRSDTRHIRRTHICAARH